MGEEARKREAKTSSDSSLFFVVDVVVDSVICFFDSDGFL